jgi:hypothetical protein
VGFRRPPRDATLASLMAIVTSATATSARMQKPQTVGAQTSPKKPKPCRELALSIAANRSNKECSSKH